MITTITMHYDHTYRSNEVSDQNDELEKVNVEFRTKFWLATVMFTMMAMSTMMMFTMMAMMMKSRWHNRCWFCTAMTTRLCRRSSVRGWLIGPRKQVKMMRMMMMMLMMMSTTMMTTMMMMT